MVNLLEQGVEQHVHVVECVSHKKTILRIYFVATVYKISVSSTFGFPGTHYLFGYICT